MGAVDLQAYTKKGGVFNRFSEIEYFKQFYVNREIGKLCRPDGVDIPPETLYHEATGESVMGDAGKGSVLICKHTEDKAMNWIAFPGKQKINSYDGLDKYPGKGKYTACVKVVDIFGCDTSITVEVEM